MQYPLTTTCIFLSIYSFVGGGICEFIGCGHGFFAIYGGELLLGAFHGVFII